MTTGYKNQRSGFAVSRRIFKSSTAGAEVQLGERVTNTYTTIADLRTIDNCSSAHRQHQHVLSLKDVFDQSIVLPSVEAPSTA
jgi:hypothetical protein